MDGTDFRIQEPIPFNKKWFSFKHRGAGLRYEVGIALESGEIVWVHGPFPASKSDLHIFRRGMKDALAPDERVVADKGYAGEISCYTPLSFDFTHASSSTCAALRARHETVNRRLKQFGVLSQRFRHHRSLHSFCFHAVANITQIMMEVNPLFHVEYD